MSLSNRDKTLLFLTKDNIIEALKKVEEQGTSRVQIPVQGGEHITIEKEELENLIYFSEW